MCYFLTIAVPAKCESLVRGNFGRGFGVFGTNNSSLQVAFPQSYRLFLLTTGMCSCDLYVDPKHIERHNDPTARAAKLRADYERRGWSSAKIERAIEQSLTHQSVKPLLPGLRPDVRLGLADLFAEAGEGGVFAHFYDEDIETACFPDLPNLNCTLEQFREGTVELPVDTILGIKNCRDQ